MGAKKTARPNTNGKASRTASSPRLPLAALASAVLLSIASSYRVPVALNLSAVLACGFLVAVLSLLSGLGAMRSLLRADPATLLR